MHVSARSGFPRPLRAHAPGLAALAAAAVAAITLSVTALGTPASAASTTAASVIKEAKAAIAAQPSAHLEFDAGSSSSSSTEKIVADVGTNQGTETVTDGSAVLHVVATPSDSYISGSATGLTSLFGMTSAEATKVGTRWEFWKKGTTQYKNLISVVSVHSLESLLPKSKGTKLATQGSDYVLTWTSAASSSTPKLSNTLTIAAKGTTLPLAETSTDASGEKVTTTISKWGEAVAVHVPPASSTVAASKISG
jgi:hypothetical protein